MLLSSSEWRLISHAPALNVLKLVGLALPARHRDLIRLRSLVVFDVDHVILPRSHLLDDDPRLDPCNPDEDLGVAACLAPDRPAPVLDRAYCALAALKDPHRNDVAHPATSASWSISSTLLTPSTICTVNALSAA